MRPRRRKGADPRDAGSRSWFCLVRAPFARARSLVPWSLNGRAGLLRVWFCLGRKQAFSVSH